MFRERCHGAAALSALCLIASAWACAGARTVATSGSPPVSRQVLFVESTSTGETMLRATGKGGSVAEALADARKAALWFVLHAGDRPLLQSAADRARAKSLEPRLYAEAGDFVRYESRLKSKRRVGGRTVVEVVLRLDVGSLKARLAAAGVRASDADVSDGAGLPMIAVIAERSGPGSDVATATLQEYLQDRHFEVFALDTGATQDRTVQAIAELEGIVDPAYTLALASKADVYVKVVAHDAAGTRSGVGTRVATVTVTAHETATGRLLGSTTGHSPERVVAGIEAITQEATNDAADKLTAQIRSAWTRQFARGRPFKVVAMTDGDAGADTDRALYAILKANSTRPVRRLGSGSNLSAYLVYATGMNNAYELFLELQRKWRGPGTLSKVRDVGGLLVVRGGDSGVEIEIK